MQDIRTPAVAIVALLATALSAGCGGGSGEGDGTPAQSTFSKSYGGAAHDVAHAVVASADGGFLLAGHANAARISSIEPEGGDLWITKLDADGMSRYSACSASSPPAPQQRNSCVRVRPPMAARSSSAARKDPAPTLPSPRSTPRAASNGRAATTADPG